MKKVLVKYQSGIEAAGFVDREEYDRFSCDIESFFHLYSRNSARSRRIVVDRSHDIVLVESAQRF